MKKEDLPQEPGALSRLTREVCYVKNEDGKYETALSDGWNVKKDALDSAWVEVNERIEEARKAVMNGEKSPIYYFMELRLMDVGVLSGYTGNFTFFTKRHFKPSVFKDLSERQLAKYASAFDITVSELKNFKG
ncbi:hypothetical protein DYBT9623_04010 [Dyadobacter sp. CECT 9623]|uniref:Uncharacterized protein n=1 Tax=Dyadobacter linearis TaxID=2823330 RepID=A0ABN7RCG2_9BACT|nr:hypothetical protein [Dyadobacter sp. CECT 9623]CAG5072073.1 hypothetical protein DYBT9623_04010 [Dyadobacter sp. CECT 9623]